VTPAPETAAEKPALPAELRDLFVRPKVRRGRRILAFVLAAALCIGAGVTGAVLGARSRTRQIQAAVPERQEVLEPEGEMEIYAVPEEERMALEIRGTPDTGALTLGEIYARNIDSVVDVGVLKKDSASVGTGIILSESGFVLTNAHVVEDGLAAYVTLFNDRVYEARLVGSDEDMDVAVLKIEAEGLTAAELGDSDLLSVGDTVVAIGDPTTNSELRGTMTSGIVSALGREMDLSVTLIQMDAPINAGNSGGPLLNRYGQVVGINVMKMTSSSSTIEGLGFAIPITAVKTTIDQLIEAGEAVHPSIGIMGFTVSAEMAEFYEVPVGVGVESVFEAAAAGGCPLEPGDVIVAADGRTVTDMADLNDVKFRHRVGETMEVSVWREGRTLKLLLPMLDAAVLETGEE